MRVQSIIVGTPLRTVSGATNAGRQLSRATADLVDLQLAVMWDSDGTSHDGPLTTRFVRATDAIGPLGRLLPRSLRTPLFGSRIPRMIRPGSADVIHIHNLIPTFAALRIARAARRAGIPYVISTHGFVEIARYAEINGFGRIKSALIDVVLTRPFRATVAGATRLFALSDRELPLLADLGVPADRVDVVTNGVNEAFLDPPPPAALESARAKWLPAGDAPVLLFMGSLHGYKGVGTFLAALAGVTGAFTAVVAGRFNDPDQPRRLLEEAGVPEAVRARVVFTGGPTDEELRALYRLSDLFVYPTAGDTLPLVVLEAMASGLPVVSTAVGGIPFEVTPECGRLVPPNDPAAVTAAVNAMLADPAALAAAGAAAHDRVARVFRWPLAARAAVEGYERALAR